MKVLKDKNCRPIEKTRFILMVIDENKIQNICKVLIPEIERGCAHATVKPLGKVPSLHYKFLHKSKLYKWESTQMI